MSDVALRIEDLGKRYLIGSTVRHDRLVYQSALALLTNPVRRLKSVLQGRSTYIDHDELWALRDINFEVTHGEVVGILGRNGAGKSTLLKILARITAPSTGRALIYGSIGALLEVGAAFHIDLTARENIYLHGSIYGRTKRDTDRIFDDIVEFAELEQFIDTQVKKFSSGMYSRLAFSVAAHFDTEILIVDEVLATGDIKFVQKCLRKMENVAMTGRTVLFVSHSIDSILRLCTRAILIEQGRITADGTVQETVAKYLASTGEADIAAPPPLPRRTWAIDEAPAFKDGLVRLLSIAALDERGRQSTEFDVAEPWVIEVEFEVVEPKHEVTIFLVFHDAMNHPMFVTMDNLESPWQGRAVPAGTHRAVPRAE